MGVAKGVADFFNMSNVSKAFSGLGDGAVERLAMNVDKVRRTSAILDDAISILGDANPASREAMQDLIKTNIKGRNAGDLAAKLASEEGSIFAKDGAYTILEGLDKGGALKKNKAFQESIEAYKKIMAEDNPLTYFGREGQGNLKVSTKIGGLLRDPEYGGTRIKTAIGAYAGAAVGARVLSGGNLTTNSRGEHDIVGIPFV